MGTPRSDSRNDFRWVREIGVNNILMKLIYGATKGMGDMCMGEDFSELIYRKIN
jgi:hypothetical protein